VTPAAAADPRSFDHLPEVFDRFAELAGGPLNDYLTARLPDRGGRAVDLGCGTGQHARLLSGVFTDVLAVDVSQPMLHYARQHRPASNICYQQRDLRDLTPATDGRFDLVLSTHTLHHLPDLSAALEQVRSLVRPGGQAILVDSVDARRRVPRGWFRAQARRALAADLARRRRPVRQAVELYQLSTDPGWLGHLATDVFLTPEEFTEVYGQVFPGAELTGMYRALAMHWHGPEPA